MVYIEVTETGKAVMEYHPESGKVTEVFESTVLDISHPLLTPDYLFLVAPLRGKDELYAFKRKSRQLFRDSTGCSYGLAYPSMGQGQWIAFSRYQADGYKPYAAKVKEMDWTPVSFPASDPFRMAAKTRQEENQISGRFLKMSRKEQKVKMGSSAA
ncbi:MAG: hypothetical protein U5L09_08520 [Bacteroidales bacterium]|nr:hypothetical protein [Bacteroidales bacterium]